MIKKLLPSLILLLTLSNLTAQQDSSFTTTFEIQAGLGIVNLLGGQATVLDMDDLGVYKKDMTEINQSGSQLQLGIIFSRHIKQKFWLRSGLQMNYLQSRANYRIEERFDDASTSLMNTEESELNIKSIGAQIPILLEYRNDLENWGWYVNAGTILSYSYPDINRTITQMNAFSFNYVYDPSCACFPTGTANEFDEVYTLKFRPSNHVEQHGVAGTLGFGAVFNRPSGNAWRVGYRVTGDFIPFHRGNNTRDKIYHPFYENDRAYRHLIHQLDFSFVWPERAILVDRSIKDQRWTGLFAGTSVSFQIPTETRYLAGREGVGWGRNLQLKWIHSSGFGVRTQYGVWIAPASNYRTRATVSKLEALYQLPFGVEFTAGVSSRDEIDVDGGGGKYRGALLGTGGMIPLHTNFGLQLDLSAHYVPDYYGEQFLMEAGIGIIFNVF